MSYYRQLMDAAKRYGKFKAYIQVAKDVQLVLEDKVSAFNVVRSTMFLAKLSYKDAHDYLIKSSTGAYMDVSMLNFLVLANISEGSAVGYTELAEKLLARSEDTLRLLVFGHYTATLAKRFLTESMDMTVAIDQTVPVDTTDYDKDCKVIDELRASYKALMDARRDSK